MTPQTVGVYLHKEADMEEKMLKMNEVAKRLNVNIRTAYRLLSQGLKYHKIGQSYRVSESDLLDYIAKSRVA